MNLEHRSLLEPPEFRSEGTRITAAGVAMRYGAKSKPIAGQFRETFSAGAFTKTIQEQDVRSHFEHFGPYLGRTANGTLRLADSPAELRYELDLPDTTAGRDVARLLERQDLRGASIGFNAIPKEVRWSVEDGMALRSVGQARLNLVDLTVAPAYDDSTAEMALRSLADERGLELRSVLEAAHSGLLPTLIETPSPEDVDDEERRSTDDGRETPTAVRQRIAWLYA